MKKKLFVCLVVLVMSLSFAFPVVAIGAAASVTQSEAAGHEDITPFNEVTRIYFRTYHGVLQMRVWSVTNIRWITDWINV